MFLESLPGKQALGSQRLRLEVLGGKNRPVTLRVRGPRGGAKAELELRDEEVGCLLAELEPSARPAKAEVRRSSVVVLPGRRGMIEVAHSEGPGRFSSLRLKLTPPRRTVSVSIKIDRGCAGHLRDALARGLALAQGDEPDSLDDAIAQVLAAGGETAG